MAQREMFIPKTTVGTGILAGKFKFLAGGALIVAAIAFLFVWAIRQEGASMYYLTLPELRAKGTSIYNQQIRLASGFDKTRIERDSKNLVLKFYVVDGKDSLPVVYRGVVPDTFEQGESVVLEGKLTPEGVFEAHSLFVQCPSKYEAQVKQPSN